MNGEHVIAVIECKAATVTLNLAAVNQAANYAIALGAEWSVVTNGHHWIMFHVSPSKGREPEVQMIFDIQILDEDGLSKEDTENLYLLTKQSILSGETKSVYHRENLFSFDNIRAAISSPEIVNAVANQLKKTYRTQHGIDVEPDLESLREVLSWMVDEAESAP